MMESYSEFKSIVFYYVNIAVIRQSINPNPTLDKIELFSCIKYLENKQLEKLFEDYYKKGSAKAGKFAPKREDIDWLIYTVLTNIVSEGLEATRYTKLHHDFSNTLFILSLIKLEKEDVTQIIQLVNQVVSKWKNTYSVFEGINLFLGIQHNLFTTEIEDEAIISILEVIINKLTYRNYNIQEYHAFTYNEISNLYGYARHSKIKFGNKKLVERLLAELSDLGPVEKIEVSMSFLITMYDISEDPIKQLIKEFIVKIDSSVVLEEHRKFPFELFLIIQDFKKLNSALIEELNGLLNKYNDRGFSSTLYWLHSQISYLIKEKSLADLEPISARIKFFIQRYESSTKFSLI